MPNRRSTADDPNIFRKIAVVLGLCAGLLPVSAHQPPTNPQPPSQAGYTAVKDAAGRFTQGNVARTGGALAVTDPAALADAGVRRVIDLRGADEDRGFDEAAAVREAGLDYIAIPITGASDLNASNVAALDAALKGFDPSQVVIHCASGNRVGALIALRAAAQGATPEAALATGRAHGLRGLEAEVAARLRED